MKSGVEGGGVGTSVIGMVRAPDHGRCHLNVIGSKRRTDTIFREEPRRISRRQNPMRSVPVATFLCCRRSDKVARFSPSLYHELNNTQTVVRSASKHTRCARFTRLNPCRVYRFIFVKARNHCSVRTSVPGKRRGRRDLPSNQHGYDTMVGQVLAVWDGAGNQKKQLRYGRWDDISSTRARHTKRLPLVLLGCSRSNSTRIGERQHDLNKRTDA